MSSRRPSCSITAIILTQDERLHVERCIESLRPVVARICVIDSGSTDGTVELARELGAEVFEHGWVNYADQFNWALDHCGIETDWILRLDADEYLEAALQAELCERVPRLPTAVHGVLLQRKYFFQGRWMRFGGMHPLYHLRLWRRGAARIEERWMDEHAVLTGGDSTRFAQAFVDDNLRNLDWWSRKHVGYATREAVQALFDERAGELPTAGSGLAGSAATKRWLKHRVYNRLPCGVGPTLYFLYRYFLRLGLLDGSTGFAFHFLQGYWYRLLVDVRKRELQRAVAGETSPERRIEALERATGLRIRAMVPAAAGATR